MEKLGEIISRIIIQEGYEKRWRQGVIFDRWSDVVGPFLAEKSQPLLVRKHVLVVQVTDAIWMHELQMQKMAILERVRELMGGEREVADVRWTVRAEDRFRRPRRMARQSSKSASRRPLDAEEKAWIQAVSAQVDDPALQRQLKRVLYHYILSRHAR